MAPVPVGRGLFGLRYENRPVRDRRAAAHRHRERRPAGATSARATPRRSQRIYEQIDQLEREPVRTRTYVRYTELFRWPLGARCSSRSSSSCCSPRGGGRCHDDLSSTRRSTIRGCWRSRRAAAAGRARAAAARYRQRQARLERLGNARRRRAPRAGDALVRPRLAHDAARARRRARRHRRRRSALGRRAHGRALAAASTWCSRSTRRCR